MTGNQGQRQTVLNGLGKVSGSGASGLFVVLFAILVVVASTFGCSASTSSTSTQPSRVGAKAIPSLQPTPTLASVETGETATTLDAAPTPASIVPSTIVAVPTDTPVPVSDSASTDTPQVSSPDRSDVFTVHFIDVGQGDSILIIGSDGKTMLIDGGPEDSGSLPYLQTLGIKRLDMVVATHPHEDHIGGLLAILQAIPVGEIVTNGQPHTTRTYERFLDAISGGRIPYREVKRGDTLQLGALTFDVLHPTSKTGSNLNNQSIVLRLVYGQTAFLFDGDAEKDAEASIVASGKTLNADILKVGHHGSRTSTSAQFLGRVKPKLAIYSAGLGNSYGHPHAETIAALTEAGADIYGTDKNGTVVVTAEGSGYSITTAKGSNPRAPPTVPVVAQLTATNVPIQPTATPVPVPPVVVPPPAGLTLEILSVTSPVGRNANATLTARTVPGANSSITVYYKSGASTAQGLGSKVADANGNVSWTWKVGGNTTPGTWRIVVTANSGGQTVIKETTFVVQ